MVAMVEEEAGATDPSSCQEVRATRSRSGRRFRASRPDRARTCDTCGVNALLYQLSYRPIILLRARGGT